MDKSLKNLVTGAIEGDKSHLTLSPSLVRSSLLDADVAELAIATAAPALSSLTVYDLQIDTPTAKFLSSALGQLPHLRTLCLVSLRASPEAINHLLLSLPALTLLDRLEISKTHISADAMRSLLDLIGALPKLESLTVASCLPVLSGTPVLTSQDSAMSSVVPSPGALPSISLASLFPPAIRRALQVLDLSDNQLGNAICEVICESTYEWSSLSILRLDGNKVDARGATRLLRSFALFPQIQDLSLRNNSIDDAVVPAIYEAIRSDPWRKSLESLQLRGNAIRGLPTPLLESGNAADLRLHAVLACDDPCSALPFATAVIVGNSGAGKTHIRIRLCRDRSVKGLPYFNPAEPRTHGWARQQMSLATIVGDCRFIFRVGVWDLGGDAEFLAAQRLMLGGSRHIFIVVCDAGQSSEENNLDRWLGMVMQEGLPGSPVIIVVNKSDLYDDAGLERRERKMPTPLEEDLRQSRLLWPESPCFIIEDLGVSLGTSPSTGAGVDVFLNYGYAAGKLDLALSDAVALAPGCSDVRSVRVLRALYWLEHKLGPLSSDDWKYCLRSDVVSSLESFGLTTQDASYVLNVGASLGWLQEVHGRSDIRAGDPLALWLFNVEWLKTPLCMIVQEGRALSRRGMLEWHQIASVLPTHTGDSRSSVLWRRMPFTEQDRVLITDLMCAQEIIFRMDQRGRLPSYFCPQHLPCRGLSEPPKGRFVWARSLDANSDVVFERVIGRLHMHALTDPAALWRDEITMRVGRRKAMIVRRCDMSTTSPGRTQSRMVFAAVSGATIQDTEKLMDMVDREFRMVLGEPVLGQNAWVMTEGAGSPAASEGVKVPDYACYAVRVYQVVRRACENGAIEVKRWEELVACAMRIATAVEAQTLGDPDFAADVRLAAADVERFARYCRMAGLSAWWSNRGRKKRWGIERVDREGADDRR